MAEEYYTTRQLTEMAADAGRPVTQSYVGRLCRQGRIEGAVLLGRDWLVPQQAAEEWLSKWIAGAKQGPAAA